MHIPLAFLALAATSLVSANPQGVTESIPPPAPIPAGCSKDYSGTFQITTINVTAPAPRKRDLSDVEKRQADILTLTLSNSILKDAYKRTGYIASNFQFQFDGPPQAGAIYTSGFSVCGNGSLALGGSAIFYQCYSGGFYNLYDRHWAPQCSPIYIEVMSGSGGAGPAGPGGASQLPDGQPQAGKPKPGGPPAVTQIPDGQPQASKGGSPKPTGKPVSQIGDGQPQAPGGGKPAPVSENSAGQPQGTAPAAGPKATGNPVGQIPDGQPQASPGGAPRASASMQPFTGAAGSVKAGFGGFLAAVLGAVAVL